MKIVFVSTMLMIVTFAGCTGNLYEGLRMKQEMECQNLQGPERDECLKSSGMSYDEYQRKMRERDVEKER
ncbi:MAG TPA: hypothetical protein VN604_08385 [Nitrospirota bacterium]|nr:hypothetical protein [Nitrospirota bacterium]